MPAFGVALTLVGLSEIMEHVSGGIFNPAVALAQIAWQNLTFNYSGLDQSFWTGEYMVCYIFGPLVGAFMGANVFQYYRKTVIAMETYVEESDDSIVVNPPAKSETDIKSHESLN